MSQGLFNALFMGAKEAEAAKKVIKFSAYFGFTAVAMVMIFLFMPYAPLQEAIDNAISNKGYIVATAVFFTICLFFVLKEKIWAPCLIVALILADMVISYIDSQAFPSAMECIQLIIYGSAIQAIHFLRKLENDQPTDT